MQEYCIICRIYCIIFNFIVWYLGLLYYIDICVLYLRYCIIFKLLYYMLILVLYLNYCIISEWLYYIYIILLYLYYSIIPILLYYIWLLYYISWESCHLMKPLSSHETLVIPWAMSERRIYPQYPYNPKYPPYFPNNRHNI